jgi:cobyric acid synthase
MVFVFEDFIEWLEEGTGWVDLEVLKWLGLQSVPAVRSLQAQQFALIRTRFF